MRNRVCRDCIGKDQGCYKPRGERREDRRFCLNFRQAQDITIIMPCYNERELIEAKIENLKGLAYPKDKMEILIIDGKSDDGTWEIINQYTDGTWLRAYYPVKGKNAQLNAGLELAKGKFIVCTDVDGVMEKSCLNKIMREFRDPTVDVVGPLVYPEGGFWLETFYWWMTNRFRLKTNHSVVGTCFAFRKGLMESFPLDVADDIFVCQEARRKGYKVVYTNRIKVKELRVAENLREFIEFRRRRWRAYWRIRHEN